MLLCRFLVVCMKHRLLGGLTLAVAISAFGVPFAGPARRADAQQVFQPNDTEIPSANAARASDSGLANDSAASTSEPAAPDQSAAPAAHGQDFELTEVYPHTLDDQQAATLFVNSIPVLTLTGESLSTAGDSKELNVAESSGRTQDPVVRAEGIAQRLARLSADAAVEDIRVRWDEDQELFVVGWGDQDLVAFNQQTMLAGTTEDPAEDALQATNRLRRLLGDAPPLTEIEGRPEPVQISLVRSSHTGMASWYGPGFHGRRSASGEVFNQHALTAAHRTLPFGTRVLVTNVHTGQQVVVRINDRGPFSHGRIIDLSAGAASQIGLRRMGVGRVQMEVLAD